MKEFLWAGAAVVLVVAAAVLWFWLLVRMLGQHQ